MKKSMTLPNLQQASNRLLDDDEDSDAGDDSEDEETLRLKLAAIEAKLKLKKLQQNRIRENSRQGDVLKQRPQSSTSNPSSAHLEAKSVQVPVSPTRNPNQPSEQRSPGRVLLGIDKGVKGADISLRRAQSSRTNRATGNNGLAGTRFAERMGAARSASVQRERVMQRPDRPVKTFSEKMAESRADKRNLEERQDAILRKRTTGFKIDRAELEEFQTAAAEVRTHEPPRSPLKDRPPPSFSRNDILQSGGGSRTPSGLLKPSSTLPSLRDRDDSARPEATSVSTLHNSEVGSIDGGRNGGGEQRLQGDPSLYDPFSQLHLSSRTLPHSFLQKTFPAESHTCLRLPQLLKQVTAPDYELPGLESTDVVVVGVIASKSSPLDHKGKQSNTDEKNPDKWDDGRQNRSKFIALQLCDLNWSIDLYLFGTAVPKYHRLSPGTVVAILNPGTMPPKKGKEDTGAFSLTIHHGEDTLLEIGRARDLGSCNAVRKDGKQCGDWVNLQKTEICEWHLNAQIAKTQAGRMGVNTGSNALGRSTSARKTNGRYTGSTEAGKGGKRGLLPSNDGLKYDRNTSSHYFMATSGDPQRHMNDVARGKSFEKSAAALIDEDDDDPFIAEGRLSRDREARLKRRLLNEEKERDIARKLTAMGAGGAGGEYLRKRLAPSSDGPSSRDDDDEERRLEQPKLSTKDNILRSETNVNGKRPADSVRLSPLKRTRFITDKGIREAGRDSFGGNRFGKDDELDIV